MELFTTADGIMSVFTKTLAKLEKHSDAQGIKRTKLRENICRLNDKLADATIEQDKTESFITGINKMLKGDK